MPAQGRHYNHRIGDDRLVLDEEESESEGITFVVRYLEAGITENEKEEAVPCFYSVNSQYFDSFGEAHDCFIKRRDSSAPARQAR